jgi:uncharacterized protein (TIGR02466 family)
MNILKMRVHKELSFPTPIYIFDYEDLSILNVCLEYVTLCETYSSKTCRTTEDNLNNLPQFSELVVDLNSKIKYVFDDLGLIRTGEKITCMWANISSSLNRHNMHMHPNSFFSGVLYLNAPKNAGNIGFKDPRIASEVLKFDFEEGSIFKNKTIEVEPITGRLILFPSWLYHGTQPGEFSPLEERVSLSFNVMPVAKITDQTRKLNLV